LNWIFILSRLIQSQPQLGASSAEALDHNPQVFTRIYIQDLFDLAFSNISYFDHILPPLIYLLWFILISGKADRLVSERLS
jgi:hypothetical protein